MSRAIQTKLSALIVASVAIGINTQQSQATTYTWTGTTNKSFNVSTNWSPSTGAPSSASDTAIFTSTGTYPATSTFIGSISGSTYGQLQFADAPTFFIGQDNTSLFTLAGVGVGNVAISRTDTVNKTQTIRNRIALSSSSETFDINGGGALVLSGGLYNTGAITGSLNGTSASSVIKKGNGTLQVDDTSRFSGDLSILDGTYQVTQIRVTGTAPNLASGLGSGTNSVTLGGDSTKGTLSYIATGTDPRTYSRGFTVGSGGGVFANNSTNSTVTLDTVGIGGTGTFTLDGTGPSTIVAVSISTAGGLTKNGTGSATVSSANSYGGATTINGGTLEVAATGKLGDGNVNIASGAHLQLDTNSAISDLAGLTIINGGSVILNLASADLTEQVGSLNLGGTLFGPGTYNQTNGLGYITGTGSITVVPEPASLSAIGLGALSLLSRRRRGRNRD